MKNYFGQEMTQYERFNTNQISILNLLFDDMFPYFHLRSITTVIILIEILWFLINWQSYSIVPHKNESFQKNLIMQVTVFFVYLILVTRLCSQYEHKLGCLSFTKIIMLAQAARIVLKFFLIYSVSFNMINSSSLPSFYILSLFRLSRAQRQNTLQFNKQQNIQNYDLLDLNDTIIKLKQNQHTNNYQSFTNRQFYHYNITEARDVRQKKKTSKKIKYKNIEMKNILQQKNQENEEYQIKIYKLIVYNFMVFSLYSIQEFSIFFTTEVLIYFQYKNVNQSKFCV